MKAITTTYVPASSSRPARVKATDMDRHRVTVPYDILDASEQSELAAHARAAIALCKKMGWKGKLIAGQHNSGYAFVFEDARASFRIEPETPLETRYRLRAKACWHDEGRIEIDDGAVVSASEEGAYVQAWVWLDREDEEDA